MVQPYIPTQDAAFDAFYNNFQTLIAAAPTDFGLVSGDATAITADYNVWNPLYVAATTPSTRTTPTIAAKDAQRSLSVAFIRPYAQKIANNPSVTDDNKRALALNLPNTGRTRVPPPTTNPALSLAQIIHNQITLAYRDTSTPTSKGKPEGAIAMEVRQFIGTAPGVDPESAPPWGQVTKSPFVVGTINGDIGKLATFWGRWVTRSGPGAIAQVGPWSAPITLAIT